MLFLVNSGHRIVNSYFFALLFLFGEQQGLAIDSITSPCCL